MLPGSKMFEAFIVSPCLFIFYIYRLFKLKCYEGRRVLIPRLGDDEGNKKYDPEGHFITGGSRGVAAPAEP